MSRQLTGRGYLSAAVMALSVVMVVATAWPQQPIPQPARRHVAVYQFNSGLPDVPGPVVREMFVAALVQTGRFTVMQPNQPGTELVMDAVINEANLAQVKVKPELNDLLKGLLTGDVRPLSFDVRVMDARNGAILDIVPVTGKDMKNTKVNLADFGSVLGSDKAKRDALNQRLLPYLNEAIARIVARHASVPVAQMQPGAPMQPGGFAQPGFPPTTAPTTDPYQQYGQTYGQTGTPAYGQTGYPQSSYPSTTSPYGTPQSGYPSTQQPYGQTGTPAYGQPATQPYGQPGYPAGTQGTTGYPPGTAAPYYGQAQPGQLQARGIGGESTMTIEVTPERLLLGFDPTKHEVADVREKVRSSPSDGDALIHTAPSGHKLYANVKKGEVQSWSAKDDKDKEIPLYLLNDEPNCWECAMNPGLCWKVMCPLESELGQPDSKK